MKPAKKKQSGNFAGSSVRASMIPTDVIKYPVSSEKAIRLMESENKLVFAVHIKANKRDIKNAVEELFKAKVRGVNTLIIGGEKRAYVRFAPESPAIDIATNMGLM